MSIIELFMSNGEFRLSILFGAIISFVIAYIVQDVLNYSHDEECLESVTVNDELPQEGCPVYDIYTKKVGTYCGSHLGDDNNIYAIVAVMEDENTLHCYHCLPDNLLTVQEQE